MHRKVANIATLWGARNKTCQLCEELRGGLRILVDSKGDAAVTMASVEPRWAKLLFPPGIVAFALLLVYLFGTHIGA